ncbi:MAG TPA: nicotinate phosphoribosyltransferase [Verrucomicrobia bacterium]|nr:nicotinate phosphoribosyltransferase [Verrucomicrobiota bacterium]
MNGLTDIYKPSLAMLTDLYQLTMAYGYWKEGRGNDEAVFHLFFRKPPFGSGYTLAAGLGFAVDYLQRFSFTREDQEYLGTLTGNDDKPLFEKAFLSFLGDMTLSVDVDAMPEGTVVFPQEPLLRVKGPLIQCQLLETALLNMINFQTLIATKAARVCQAARGEPVLEFGLRRAQGVDGSISASRAAYIGGCAATSNVLAGQLLGIPVKGTHAHSWVMTFDSEAEAFERYADAMPNNCVFLIDTYDTLEGVRNAIAAGTTLRSKGYEMVGVRLDSGDLAYLSIEARKLLDAAGFENAVIIASNDLDEHIIESLKQQDAKIAVWGVGTKLVTAYDQPSLGGVYKLSAIRRAGEGWQYRVKLSEQSIKTSTPGILQVRRFSDGNGFVADMIYNEDAGEPRSMTIVDPLNAEHHRTINADMDHTDLLLPVLRAGHRACEAEGLPAIRDRAAEQCNRLHGSIRRFTNPHTYPCGLDADLHHLKSSMISSLRENA